ncbi:hypothetical protein Tco_1298773 [Tanacetum coccineum]
MLWLSLHATLFKIDKRKRFKLTLELLIDIFKICPRVQGQDFDALSTDKEIVSLFRDLCHTGEIHSLNDVVVDQMHQPWRTFAALINKSLSRKTTGLDKLRLSRAQILWGMYHQKNMDYVELLWEDFIYQIDNKAYKKQEKMMHTSKDDYLINTLRFVSAREETQIYGVILPESLTSPEMKETKAYKTYLEPLGKSERVKRPAKKSTQAPARGVVIRETPEIPVSKKKESMDVARGKGIKLLSDVALTKEAQYEEVRRKSMRDFHKTHLSGYGTVTKPTPSAAIIKPSVTNEETGVKPVVLEMTEEKSSENKVESWGNDEDDNNNDQDSKSEESDQDKDSNNEKSQSDNEDESDSKHETNENKYSFESNQEDDEEKIKDDEEEEDDELLKLRPTILMMKMKLRLLRKLKVMRMKRWIILQGIDAAMTNVQQGNENLEISQVIEDAHVTLSTVPQKTKV